MPKGGLVDERPPNVASGHIFLAIALGFGVLAFTFGVLEMSRFARNLCAGGCGGEGAGFISLAAGAILGLVLIVTFCIWRGYGWWPKTAGLVTAYLWLIGMPLSLVTVFNWVFSVP